MSAIRAASIFLLAILIALPTSHWRVGANVEAPPAETVALSLDQAVRLAQMRSFRTARSRRSEQIAQLRYRNARAAYYPRADLSVSAAQSARGFRYESDQFDFQFDQPVRGEFRGGVLAGVSMPLDISGAIKRQVGQADATRRLWGHDVVQSNLDVTLEAQNGYLNALRAQNAVDAEERLVADLEGLLSRSRMAAPEVVPFLEVELGNAQQSLVSSRTSADQAQDGLKQTLRVPPETRLRLTTRFADRAPPAERRDLLERALAARPDVQQAKLRIRQAEIAIRQASDELRPTASVGAFYSDQVAGRSLLNSERDSFRNQGVGVSLALPLARWDNGQLSNQKRIARLQQEQAVADAEEVRERVAYELKQSLLAVERAENRLRTLPDPKAALEALKRAEEGMLSAPGTEAQALLAQVTNARNAWRSAETASADAYIDYNAALFRLNRTIGEGHAAEDIGLEGLAALLPKLQMSP